MYRRGPILDTVKLRALSTRLSNSSVPRTTVDPCAARPSAGPCVPPSLERAIAARWQIWVPWACMYLLRARQHDPTVNAAVDSPEFHRLYQRHREHILDLMRDGVSMRTIRRHRLDDPRLTDEVRAMLVRAARARQSKAWFWRPAELRAKEKLATLIRLGPSVKHVASSHLNNESPQEWLATAVVVLDPPALKEAIQTIRRLVCEHFYLAEMRDPELMVRTNRRAYVLPRQIAMYTARQLTGASLQEIGREFGGRHHTTVLHSINKIEEMRRSDEGLNRTITQFMGAVATRA
jgi:Bacterial dnaA protein helix-turn-helix